MAEATAADYAWLDDHWWREAFCITLVRGLDEAEVLRRFGGEHGQPRTLTAGEAAALRQAATTAARQAVWCTEDHGRWARQSCRIRSSSSRRKA